jgi:hypothetical protein
MRIAPESQDAIDDANVFVSRTPFAVADLPPANKHTNKIALLSNGTFWLAKSDGSVWRYPDNTAV